MKITIIFMLFLFILLGCRKNPFDFRSKYVGDYDFSVHKTTWTLLGHDLDTTYFWSGDIKEGSESNRIVICFSEAISAVADIYEDGTIDAQYQSQSSLRGEFESVRKVKFILRTGGLGGGTIFNVIGEKK